MKLFLDSADIVEIEKVLSYGILEGVTTNPSLIKEAAKKNKIKDIEVYIKKILKLCKGLPVSLEVIGSDYDSMLREGKLLFKKFNSVAKNVYVKIPINPCMKLNCSESSDGVRVIKYLSKAGIPVNCTLVFTPEQAFLAAKAGAKFVSPFVGRENDYILEMSRTAKGRKLLQEEGVVSGVDLVAQISEMFVRGNIETEILAASIRSKIQLREVAFAGADIATVPFEIIEVLTEHVKTVEGMKKFTKDVIPEYAKIFGTKFKGGENNV